MRCIYCGNELIRDPKNDGKVLCTTCRKRFDEQAVRAYWQTHDGDDTNTESTDSFTDDDGTLTGRYQPDSYGNYQQPMSASDSQYVPLEYEYPQPDQQGYGKTTPANASYQQGYPQPNIPYPSQGNQQYPPQSDQPTGQKKTLAIVALVFGLIGIVTAFIPFMIGLSYVAGLIALIISIVALVQIHKKVQAGKGMAIAGLILGIIAPIISTIVFTLMIIGLSGLSADEILENPSDTYQYYQEYKDGNLANGNNTNILGMIDGNGNIGDESPMTNENASVNENALDNAAEGNVLDQTNETTETTPASPAPVASDEKPFDGSFTLDGKTYQMSVTTLEQLVHDGWKYDTTKYNDSYVVNPHEDVFGFNIYKGDNNYTHYAIISLRNASDSGMPVTKCTVCYVAVTAFANDTPTFSTAGVTLGTDRQTVLNAFAGEQDPVAGDTYLAFESVDGAHNIDFNFDANGVVNSISYSID